MQINMFLSITHGYGFESEMFWKNHRALKNKLSTSQYLLHPWADEASFTDQTRSLNFVVSLGKEKQRDEKLNIVEVQAGSLNLVALPPSDVSADWCEWMNVEKWDSRTFICKVTTSNLYLKSFRLISVPKRPSGSRLLLSWDFKINKHTPFQQKSMPINNCH